MTNDSRWRVRRRWGLLTILVAVLTSGCGYSFRGNIPDHIKTVAVPIFKNATQAAGVENAITSAVVAAFSNSGRLAVVPTDQADSILEGEIVGYSFQGTAFDRNATVQAYRLQVVLNLVFRDLRENSVLWREQGLTQAADFSVQGQVSDTVARIGAAGDQAAAEIGRKIVGLAMDRF